ncbi:MAG: tRNA (adenosine(37)-N6)-threonylcarbamoyltransferase complex transferase subunit TsaD [Clostridiales bacterium]|nr:tRNA (adenosine(37)-N6)-threonylcarbamoyltransferase complex transferase subunit TsaD [Clostridiales bacterium]
MNDVIILGIETSCDETCAAMVKNGREALSSAIYSQIDLHRRFGGVVPEIASRNHLEKIGPVVREAMEAAGLRYSDLTAVAAANGPGLVGALIVGVSYAKALAYAINKPLVAVNHIEGHICANYIADPAFEPPYVCLVVSGGHTMLAYVSGYGRYERLGSTRDDAAGEAFDKAARLLGLPYPGGVEIDRLAAAGTPSIKFPKASVTALDFSFSGLKSAVANFLQKPENANVNKADIAASFQAAVVDVLTEKALAACAVKDCKTLALAGGVAANSALRRRMAEACAEKGIELRIPPVSLCTDNGAMVASAGYYRYINGETAALDLNAYPGLELA